MANLLYDSLVNLLSLFSYILSLWCIFYSILQSDMGEYVFDDSQVNLLYTVKILYLQYKRIEQHLAANTLVVDNHEQYC